MKMKLTSVIVALATCAIANAEPPKEKGKAPRGGARPVAKEILEKFDKDKDGKLNAEERKVAGEARKAEILKKFDKDKDGKLSAEERKDASDARRAEMIKKFDKNTDGKLSEEERAEMRKAMPPRGNRPARGKGAPEGKGKSKSAPEGKGKGKGKGKGGPKKGKKPAAVSDF